MSNSSNSQPGRYPAFGPRPAPIAAWYDGEGPHAGLVGGPVVAVYPALIPHLVAADALAFARRQRFRR